MGNGALLGLHPMADDEWRKCMYGQEGRTLTEELEEELEQQRSQHQIDVKQPQEKIPGIRIEGAVGINACHINHSFVRTKTMYNERPLYRSLSEENHWLRYTTDSRWMVGSTIDKEDNLSGGFCYCRALGLFEPCQAKRWYVLGRQKAFRMQTKVKAIAMTSTEVMHNGRTIRKALPSIISFQGVTGELATKINGVYKWKMARGAAQIQHNSARKLMFWRYKPQTSGIRSVLMYDSAKRWIVVQGTQVLAYCESTGLSTPCDATRWNISNCKNEFAVQPSVTVTPFDSNKKKDSRADQQTVTGKFPLRPLIVASTDHEFIYQSANRTIHE